MRRECHHDVPSGTHLAFDASSGGLLARAADGTTKLLPRCAHALPFTELSNVTRPLLRASTPLPPDYNGWMQYTAFTDAAGFDAFLGNFSVPDACVACASHESPARACG